MTNCELEVNAKSKIEKVFYHSVKHLCDNLRKDGLTVLRMTISNGYPQEAQHADAENGR